MAIQSLGYIGLGARDLVDWHAYAKTIMGADIREIDDALVLRLDSRDWRIRVEQNANEDILYVGWETGGAEEFTDTVETLKSVGVGVENDPDFEVSGRLGDLWIRLEFNVNCSGAQQSDLKRPSCHPQVLRNSSPDRKGLDTLCLPWPILPITKPSTRALASKSAII